jgi:hypothetical protein
MDDLLQRQRFVVLARIQSHEKARESLQGIVVFILPLCFQSWKLIRF